MVSYCLMFLQSPYLTYDAKEWVGYFQILIYCLNMLANTVKLFNKMYYESLPEMYVKYKAKKSLELH